jgi:DNA-binding MarR family transcriptional regulator
VSDKSAKAFNLDDFIPYLVNVLASRLSLDLARVYQSRFGISIPEWRVLAHLKGHAKVSVRDVYDRVAMDKVKVSRAAARLKASGYIVKDIHPTDHRLVELQLSERGRALVAKIAPLAVAYENEVLSRLSETGADGFHRRRA